MEYLKLYDNLCKNSLYFDIAYGTLQSPLQVELEVYLGATI